MVLPRKSFQYQDRKLIEQVIIAPPFRYEAIFQNNNELLELKIKELILLLIQSKNAESVHQRLSDLFSPRRATLREVVSTHLYFNLSHKEMAKLCNLSRSTFKREFEKVFSDTPANYILTKKLERDYELLKVSNQSISDIAYDTGFNDPSYFSRVFKNRFGNSPTQFRANRNEVN